MIKNQDDLDEILSVKELQHRKSLAYETLESAIIASDIANKAYTDKNDVILNTIDDLCNESIIIDNELKKFRKAASEGIIFGYKTSLATNLHPFVVF